MVKQFAFQVKNMSSNLITRIVVNLNLNKKIRKNIKSKFRKKITWKKWFFYLQKNKKEFYFPFRKVFFFFNSSNNGISSFKILQQYLIKCGNKYLLENIFRNILNFWAKNSLFKNKNFEKVLDNAFKNTTPYLGVICRKKRFKTFYKPIRLIKRRRDFLNAKWILSASFIKKKYKFFDGILEEIFESFLKKSTSVKKFKELYSLVESSLFYFK